MKFLQGAGLVFVLLSARSAFGTLEPCWMYGDNVPTFYSYFRYCDTARNDDVLCTQYPPDTGDTYDGTAYINFDYQFNHDSIIVLKPFDTAVEYRDGPRPGYAGFKTAWDGGLAGFHLARYKYLVLAHKGPLLTHKVTVRFWYNNGDCGAASYNEYIGTFAASSAWKVDTIPIPESFQNRPDSIRNGMLYYEMVVLINNLDPNDTTSGLPGNLKIDNIRLVGCNPIDTSPRSQTVTEGEAVTLRVVTTRADSADVLTYQWKKDGADIAAGANNSVYTLASVKTADAGTYTVAVTVSSTNLSFTSQSATLAVNTPEKKNCGCGSGTGMALIPPLFFKAMAHRKRKKKSLI
jgi:hypothetical protein